MFRLQSNIVQVNFKVPVTSFYYCTSYTSYARCELLFIALLHQLIVTFYIQVTIFFSQIFSKVGFFIRSLPYGSQFSPTCDLDALFTVMSQYLVRLLSLCWITCAHRIHPPIEGLLLSTGTESTPFQNLASKVA